MTISYTNRMSATQIKLLDGMNVASQKCGGLGSRIDYIQFELPASNDYVNVKTFGAIGNGIVDDTSAFSSAIARIVSAGYGTLYVPTGTYKVTGGFLLTVPTFVVGDGVGMSTVSCSTISATVFTFSASNSGIRDISLTYSSVGTGTAILLNNSQEIFYFERIYITNCGHGIHINNYVLVRGSKFTISNYAYSGIWADSAGDTSISEFQLYAGNDAMGANGGLYFTGTQDTFSAAQGSILTGVHGIYTAQNLIISNFYDVICDSTAEEPLYALNLKDTFFTNCWFSGGRTGTGYNGVFLGGSCDTIKFNGCKFQNNGANGIFVANGCVHISMTDCTANNNKYSSTVGAGYWVENGTDDFTITHCFAGNSLGTGWGTQDYGIIVDTGCDHYIVDCNNLRGNTYGGLLNNSSGAADKYIAGNLV